MRWDWGYAEEGKLAGLGEFRVLGWLARWLVPYWAEVAVGAAAVLGAAGLELSVPYLLRMGIDQYLMKAAELGRAGAARGVGWIAGAMAAAGAGAFVLGYLHALVLERAGQKMIRDMRLGLHRRIMAMELVQLESTGPGPLVTRLTSDMNNIAELLRSVVTALVQDSFMVVGIAGVLVWMEPVLGGMCLGGAGVVGLGAWVFARRAREAFWAMQRALGRINAWAGATLKGLGVVRILGAEQAVARAMAGLSARHLSAGLRQVRVFALFMPLGELVGTAVVAAIICYGGARVVEGQLSLGTLVAFISYMQMFFRPVRELAEKYNMLQAAVASAWRIKELMDQPVHGPAGLELPAPRGKVGFHDAGFSYPGAGAPALGEIDLELAPGEHLAVVGPTGSGKSTLLMLAAGLYRPSRGRVVLDGVEVWAYPPVERARRVALVPQQAQLLPASLGYNVSLGRQWVGRQEVVEALKAVGLWQLVEQLPQGLETPVGEGGRRLSAGQAQLVAIARAIAGRPRVVLMDEATSNVDPATERAVREGIRRMLGGRTGIVVAHRLEWLRPGQRVVVLRGGRIIQQGTHEELASRPGAYQRLVRILRDAAGADTGRRSP